MQVKRAEQVPIQIKVKTMIQNEEETQSFELTTFGQYYQKDQSYYLQYEEVLEEGTIKTIVKVTEGAALILRTGAIQMRLPFKLKQRLRGSYETPYGTLDTTTYTKQLEHSLAQENNEGSVDIIYDLAIHGSIAGIYHINITFKEENE
ncbi:DUF1934 domain-containing protein [Cytobacillus sp. Hz8]|uniref:DUF1934 domain-containing protein n=1 Tax=Cytobacillus sp. Hz8 TaxID=3347168 RepID=UPI0035DAE591